MSIVAAVPSYEELTISSPSLLKRWSHASRYSAALAVADIAPNFAIADYGAGDGHLLRTLAARGDSAELWAFDPAPAEQMGSRIRSTNSADSLPTAYFDRVFCTEVLEHLEPAEIERALSNIGRVLKPGGKAVITVPVEIGPAAVIKSIVRGRIRAAHAGGLADAMRSLFGKTGGMQRAADRSGYIASHVGFDYRVLPALFEAHGFAVSRSRRSPLPWAWPGLNSQIVFVLHHSTRTLRVPLARSSTPPDSF